MSSLLLVDDDYAVRESLGEYLGSLGHELHLASSLPEAIDIALRFKPDAIVSDLFLDNESGLTLKAELAKRFGVWEPYFILLSGQASLESALKAIDAGVDQYLLKPVKLDELGKAVEQGMRAKAAEPDSVMVRFALAERFYHDLSLPMNLLIPRMCMLLEDASAVLSPAQGRNVGEQFKAMRRLLWLMKEFYPRLLDNSISSPTRKRVDAGQLMDRVLDATSDDLRARKLVFFGSRPRSEKAILVDEEAAEFFLEVLILRAAAIASHGSRIEMEWSLAEDRLRMELRLDERVLPDEPSKGSLAALVPIVPFSRNCLSQAGIDLQWQSAAGPWSLEFDLA